MRQWERVSKNLRATPSFGLQRNIRQSYTARMPTIKQRRTHYISADTRRFRVKQAQSSEGSQQLTSVWWALRRNTRLSPSHRPPCMSTRQCDHPNRGFGVNEALKSGECCFFAAASLRRAESPTYVWMRSLYYLRYEVPITLQCRSLHRDLVSSDIDSSKLRLWY